MATGEGEVIARVPVLGEDDVGEVRRDAMDRLDDGVAIGHGERAAGAEVILYVDDEEDVSGEDLHRGHGDASLPSVARLRALRDEAESCLHVVLVAWCEGDGGAENVAGLDTRKLPPLFVREIAERGGAFLPGIPDDGGCGVFFLVLRVR